MTNSSKVDKRYFYTTIIGLLLMTILSVTKIVPNLSLSGITVLVGVVSFFITDSFEKRVPIKSGLRFKTFFSDLKQDGVLPLVFLPVFLSIATLLIGDVLFKGAFRSHVLERTSSMLSFDKLLLLMVQIIIAAFGEEIAWRGFFLGKLLKMLPFWFCAILSSLLFAIAHIATGNVELVRFDVLMIFIDSLIYARIYKKTENCLVTSLSHILANATGIIFLLMLK